MSANLKVVGQPAPANDTDPEDTFALAVAAIRPVLYRRALMLSGNRDDANDLVQETIAKALKARHCFQTGSNLRAWAMSIMRNIFIDECRRRSHWEQGDPQPTWTPNDGEPPGPIDLLSMADVEAALASLPPHSRQAFKLVHLDHLSYRQIANLTGIPTNTLGVRLHRARRLLRRALQRAYRERFAVQEWLDHKRGSDPPLPSGPLAPVRRGEG